MEVMERTELSDQLQQAKSKINDTAARLKIADRIAHILGSTLEPEELFRTIADEIRKVIPCDRCVLASIRSDAMDIHYWYISSETEFRDRTDEEAEQAWKWFLREVYEPGQSVYIPDMSKTKMFWSGHLTENSFKSLFVIPVFQGTQCVAHLSISKREANGIHEEERELLTRISAHLGSAIRNATLYEKSRERASRLIALQNVNRSITENLDSEQVLERIAVSVMNLAKADSARIFLFNESTGKLKLRASSGVIPEGDIRRFAPGNGLMGTIMKTGDPILLPDVQEDSRWQNKGWVQKHGLHSYIAHPIRQGGKIIAIISCLSRKIAFFSLEDLDLLAAFASQAAIAIQNAALHEEAARSRDFFRSAVADNSDPITIVDSSGKFIFWNSASEKLFGYTKEEALGRSPEQIIVPEYKLYEKRREQKKVFEGESVQFDTCRLRKDGSTLPVNLSISPILDRNGKITALIGIHRDLTERTKMQEKLRESEERFRGAFESAAHGMAIASPEGRWLKVNRAFCEIVGYNEEELLKADFQSISHPEDLADSLEKVQNLLSGKIQSYTWEKRYLHKLGSVVWILLSVSLVRNSDGNPLYMVGQIQDITNRKQAEEELRTLTQAVKQSPVCVVITDPLGHIEYVNPRFEQLTGYRLDEIIGKNPSILKSEETPPEQYKELWKTIISGREWRGEFYNRKKSGEFYWVSATIAGVRDSDGKISHFLAVEEDITERKRAEEDREKFIQRLRKLNEMSQRVSASLDIEEVLKFIVREAAELLNVEFVGFFLKQKEGLVLTAVHGDWDRMGSKLKFPVGSGGTGRVAETGEPLYIPEVLKDTRWWHKSWAEKLEIGSFLGVPVKRIDGVIGVLSCLTKGVRRFSDDEKALLTAFAQGAAIAFGNAEVHSSLEKSYEELRRHQKMVVRAEKLSSIGTLTAGAAHEILNPANIIGLHGQRMLWDSQEGTDERESAKVIVRNVERITQICDDLRRFSREEPSSIQPFDPDQTIQDCLRPLGPEMRLHSVELQTFLSESNSIVMGDQHQLEQVFFNIFNNAVDAMPEGGTLTVKSWQVMEEQDGWWELRVSDTGMGIPENIIDKIFDPFFTTKPEDKGTGLGLSVSYGIIESHGGKIWAKGAPGKGTTFIVRLPLAKEDN